MQSDRSAYRRKPPANLDNPEDNPPHDHRPRPRSLDSSANGAPDKEGEPRFVLAGSGIKLGGNQREVPPVTPTDVDQKVGYTL